MKIAINKDYGGFSLSEEAYEYLGIPWDGFGFAYSSDDMRTRPELIECIETLGTARASGPLACVAVIEIPDDVDYYIDDYDGIETVEEAHRSWS